MSDRYRVKFQKAGRTVYGIVCTCGDQAKKSAKAGFALVEDAVLPRQYQVKDSDLTDIPFNLEPGNEYDLYVEGEYQKAQAVNDALPAKGVRVGHLFATAVGDGNAFYVVTQVKAGRCEIEWRSFQGDRYVDLHFGYGGWFARKNIMRYLGFERSTAALLSGG